ncbi:MAG: hypothetical protein LBP40_05290 [Campylobacteraceae bacterium]|jgi:hypothetical protein|nr:hypothetical protein [Campylobacteraceae bacterium]
MAKSKKEKVKNSATSIITIDPYSATSYKFSSNEIVESNAVKVCRDKNKSK